MSFHPLLYGALLGARVNDLWYMVPLIVVIALVYSATRHERLGSILLGTARTALWIVCFMGIVGGVLYAVTAQLP